MGRRRSDDRVVGVVTYCPPGSPWREIGRDDEGEFRMLAVDPAAQGIGAGTALARLCEERAREHGADRDGAVVARDDDRRAHGLRTRSATPATPDATGRRCPGVDLLAFSKSF